MHRVFTAEGMPLREREDHSEADPYGQAWSKEHGRPAFAVSADKQKAWRLTAVAVTPIEIGDLPKAVRVMAGL